MDDLAEEEAPVAVVAGRGVGGRVRPGRDPRSPHRQRRGDREGRRQRGGQAEHHPARPGHGIDHRWAPRRVPPWAGLAPATAGDAPAGTFTRATPPSDDSTV